MCIGSAPISLKRVIFDEVLKDYKNAKNATCWLRYAVQRKKSRKAISIIPHIECAVNVAGGYNCAFDKENSTEGKRKKEKSAQGLSLGLLITGPWPGEVWSCSNSRQRPHKPMKPALRLQLYLEFFGTAFDGSDVAFK